MPRLHHLCTSRILGSFLAQRTLQQRFEPFDEQRMDQLVSVDVCAGFTSMVLPFVIDRPGSAAAIARLFEGEG